MFFDIVIPDIVARGLILSAISLLWIVCLVRLVGLRSFSKMTNFDFVMTVGMGSLLAGASQATSWGAFVQALTAMAGLFALQYGLARIRQSHEWFEKVIQNEPLLLMKDGEIFEDALVRSRVTKGDLIAKLREANVLEISDVRAAVLETTGDVSVLHGDRLAGDLLRGVWTTRAPI